MRALFRQVMALGAGAVMVGLVLWVQVAWAQNEAKDLYVNKCAICHGQDGAGKTARGKKLKVLDVRETSKKMSADEMIKVVENGKTPNMDAYGKELSKEQIKALVDYYRSLAKQ